MDISTNVQHRTPVFAQSERVFTLRNLISSRTCKVAATLLARTGISVAAGVEDRGVRVGSEETEGAGQAFNTESRGRGATGSYRTTFTCKSFNAESAKDRRGITNG
jgi:hypothetical protein